MKDFKKIFKELARAKQATAADHLEYFILKAITAKSNVDKVQIASDMIKEAFLPTTNKNKLDNGQHPNLGLIKAMFEAFIYPTTMKELEGKTFATRPLLDCIENDMELWQYRNIISTIRSKVTEEKEFIDHDYLFFFVRNDIDPGYQAVQAAHAALLLGKELDGYDLNKLNFVVCGASKLDLERNIPERIRNGFEKPPQYVGFYEPDLHGEITCIGTHPIPYSQKSVFGDYKLLKFYANKFDLKTEIKVHGGPDLSRKDSLYTTHTAVPNSTWPQKPTWLDMLYNVVSLKKKGEKV